MTLPGLRLAKSLAWRSFLILLFAAVELVSGAAETAAAKSGFVAAPVFYYTPETRIAGGLVGIHYFRLGAATVASRLSHYRFNLIYTQNRQTVAQVDSELYLAGGKFLIDTMAKYSYYPGRFYGVGNRTTEEDREDFTSSGWRLQLDPQRRWGKHFYAGLRLEAQSVLMRETEEGGVLATGSVPGAAGGAMAGIGVFAKWDSRDNTFSTARGSYAGVFLSRFFPGLGSDYSFGQLSVDARGYWPLGRGAVLAAQGVFKTAWGDCPFQLLPQFGGLNLLRGYYDGRYRDRVMLALQGECRLPIAGRFGLCGFAGIAQVQGNIRDLDGSAFHAAGGAGLRYKFNRRENLNLRLDVGFAGKSPAFYLTFAEAF